jgi:CBS domain containing-hemolysin-like protein
MIALAAAAAALLLLGSGILTAAQAAAFQITPSRLRTLEREGFRGAGALARVRENEITVRASARMIARFFNFSAFGIVVALGVDRWQTAGPVIVLMFLGIITVHLVADVAPHVIAAKSPVRIALGSAPALLLLARWARPLTRPIEQVGESAVSDGGEPLTTEHRELLEIQEIGQEEGVIGAAESRLVERAFRLDELTAHDVMVPRVDIFAWSDDTLLDDIISTLPDVPYSRVPVYHGTIDNVTGIVYVREAYERYVKGDRTVPLAELARSPFFVPGALSLTKLLQDFRDRRVHVGVVADEFGGTDGIVTLQDVVKELVGEIHDEMDQPEEKPLVMLSPSSIEADATIDLRALNERLHTELPEEESRSLNGFILEEVGQVPKKGASFEAKGVRVDILDSKPTYVVRARVTRLPEPEVAD